MDQKLVTFLETRRETTGFYTHISQIHPKGKYNIQKKDNEEFWKIYCDLLKGSEKGGKKGEKKKDLISGLAEKPGPFIPVFNDTDIKITYDPKIHSLDTRLYNESHILETVKVYQKYLKQIIKNYKPEHGICFVLEKKLPTITVEKNNISHGFHLHFPYVVMSKVDQDVHLLPRIINEIRDKKIFEDIGVDSETAIDKSCTSKHWLLYGSKKDVNKQYYTVSKIYDEDQEIISLDDAMENFKLLDSFGDEIKVESGDYEYYLPRILSIFTEYKDTVSVIQDLQIINKKNMIKAADIKKQYENIPIPEILKKAKKLMELISPSRADDYGEWLDIGWTLHSIGGGCQEALDIWTEFSSKTTKKNSFSEKECFYQWGKMENRGKTIGTLYHYAKLDSPEKYEQIKKTENEKLFQQSMQGGHYDLALWLKNKFGDEFKCADLVKDAWFRFENHGWNFDPAGRNLALKIPVVLVEEYKKIKKKITQDMGDEDDVDADNNKKLKEVNKMIGKLKDIPFIKNVMKACQLLFFDETFMEKADTDPYKMRFKNGVMDLKEMKLRPGRPDDYLTLSTGYNYVPLYDDHPDVVALHEHLDKVFPDPELKRYYLEYCAMLLRGGNKQKKFLVASGDGNNAKSINMDLLQLVFGKYMKVLPTSVLTGKRTQSSQATPEMSGIVGVRFVVIQEPEGKDVINIGILKELSGNDMIYVRGLFREGQNVLPMFKLALTCNALPRLPCDDPATWNRIRVLIHEATFTNNTKDKTRPLLPSTIDEQYKKHIFPMDVLFKDKLPLLRDAMIWTMFEVLSELDRAGLSPEPERVTSATLLYRENNDVFFQFIKEKVIYDPSDKECCISLTDLYVSFREWFRASFPNLEIPDKNSLRKDITAKWGEVGQNKKWNGYRIREDSDDLKDGKAFILGENDLLQEEKKGDEKSDDGELCYTLDEEEEEREEIAKFKPVRVNNPKRRRVVVPEKEESDEDDEPVVYRKTTRGRSGSEGSVSSIKSLKSNSSSDCEESEVEFEIKSSSSEEEQKSDDSEDEESDEELVFKKKKIVVSDESESEESEQESDDE
jgi:phage/plasmid-associated DNA primase